MNIHRLCFSSSGTDITLGTFNNDTQLSKVSEQIMVTKGEWELEKIDIKYDSIFKGKVPDTNLVYVVRNHLFSFNNSLPLFESASFQFACFYFQVTMSRKPLLYVVNLIVPLLYLLVLDLASFFISESRGEKLSFKVTILLSISVLLLILQDMLPSTEATMPFIGELPVPGYSFRYQHGPLHLFGWKLPECPLLA